MIGILRKANVLSKAALAVRALAVVVLAATMLSVSIAWAEEPAYELDMPAQDLNSALKSLAVETDRQVLFSAAVVNGHKSPAINGEYSTTEAMDILLADSDLTYDVTESNVLLVKAADSDERGASDSKNLNPTPLLMAQSVTTRANNTEYLETYEDTEDDADDESPSDKGIPEIIVTGRSTNVDIRRSVDDIQPYVIFSSDEIETSQAVSLENFLQTRLPMNTSKLPNTVFYIGSGGNLDGGTSINLRGLGSHQTLILVNGRRMAGVGCCGSILQPDINSIPMGSIERIEILPSTAGGIYGASANGGVINIILKRNYTGGELIANYANVVDGNAMTRSIEGNIGFSVFGNTTDVLLSARFSDAGGPLRQGDRHFAAQSRLLAASNNGAAFAERRLPPSGATTNISSAAGNLVLDPQYGGTALNSTFTHIPLGYQGVSSDNGAALISNAGSYNLEVPNDLKGLQASLWDGPTSEAFSINIHSSLSENVDVFLESSHSTNEYNRVTGTVGSAILIGADAPTNPFQQPIYVSLPTPQISGELFSRSESVRMSGGVIAKLPKQWSAVLDYTWGRNRKSNVYPSSPIDFAGHTSLRTGLPAADGRPALDALQESNTYPIDFGPYLMPSGSAIFGPADSTARDLSLRLAGPIAVLSAGPLNVSMRVARSESDTDNAFREQLSSTDRSTYYYTLWRALSQHVDTGYLEMTIPLVSEAKPKKFIQSLDVQASVRHDRHTRSAPPDEFASVPFLLSKDNVPPVDYVSSSIRSTNTTLGFRYRPTKSLAIRASAGTGYLPPCFLCISSTTLLWQFGPYLPDPKRGGLTGPFVGGEGDFEYVFGGRPDLLPEDSESWSVGLIYTPESVSGLRLSADFVRIDKVNEMGGVSESFLLANEDNLFSDRVIREPLTDADAALGYTGGRITRLDITAVNLAHTSLEAYDFQLNYTFDTDRWGSFSAYAIGTWTRTFYQQLSPELPEHETVGLSDGPLEWRGNVGVDWTNGPWKLSWNAQHYDEHSVVSRFDSESATAQKVLVQGASTIPSQTYHDVVAVYRFGESSWLPSGSPFDGLELSFGMQNVFDQAPPVVVTQDTFVRSGFSQWGDPRMRRYAISARMRF